MTSRLRRSEVKWWEVEGEAVVYDPDSGSGHVLNGTAFGIWCLCDGEHSLFDITQGLIQLFPEQEESIRVDVPTIARQLVDLGLATEQLAA
jgi:hypothetical protein